MVSTRILALVMAWVMGGTGAARADWNAAVMEAVRAMPGGGGYAVTSQAGKRFRDSVRTDGAIRVASATATPSYCSSATYLVLLRAVSALESRGVVQLTESQRAALAPKAQADGAGVWGRWNANGPGAACLFAELGLGKSFVDFAEAQPGDFLKIFWTDAVGKNERGHLVVYLGTEKRNGEEWVRFWSSNKPDGYGTKSVPRSKIARALFCRLENPWNFSRIDALPKQNSYLAGLLKRESSFAEACRMAGVR
jgi:hypothetical protein